MIIKFKLDEAESIQDLYNILFLSNHKTKIPTPPQTKI